MTERGGPAPPGWPERVETLDARLVAAFARLACAETTVGALARPTDWDAHPRGGGWSPAEVLEHVALANRYLGMLIHKLARRAAQRAKRTSPPRPEERADELERLAARSFRWPHPAHMAPSGAVEPGRVRAELERQLADLRATLREAADGRGALVRMRFSLARSIDGGDDRLDLYQWLLLVALHAERHAGQLERALRAVAAERADA